MRTIYVSDELLNNKYFEVYEELGFKGALEVCSCGFDVDKVLEEYHINYDIGDMGDYYLSVSEDDSCFNEYLVIG